MAYQEVKTENYGTRLSNSFKGIVTGLIMFVAGTVLIWWNEGRAVKTSDAIDEAQQNTVLVDNVSKIDPSLEGQLIHAQAFANSLDSLTDAAYGVGARAININREVEYYQWVEHAREETRERIGGTKETVTTYTYEQKWVSEPNTDPLKDPAYAGRNFALTTIPDNLILATNVQLGAYKLPGFIIDDISGSVPVMAKMTQDQVNQLSQSVMRNDPNLRMGQMVANNVYQGVQQPINQAIDKGVDAVVNKVIEEVNDTTGDSINKSNAGNDSVKSAPVQYGTTNVVDAPYAHVRDNVVYIGPNPNAPSIGDVRITFTCVMPKDISIIAVVSGDTFKRYKASNGNQFYRVASSKQDADDMFDAAQTENAIWTWVLRVVGVLLVCGGVRGLFGWLIALFNFLPFLSKIVGLGVNLICNVFGFVWSLLVFAVAWLFYRPILAICILVVAGALIYYLVKRGKDQKKEEKAEPESSKQATPPPVE